MNVVLKNKLHELKTKFRQTDELNLGFLSYQQFEKIMKKLPINDSILNTQDMKNIFN